MGCPRDKCVHVVGINFNLVSFLYLLFQIMIINLRLEKLTWFEIFEPKPNFIPHHVFYCLPDIP